MAARLDYPVDRIDDLRLAVDEACALVLTDAPEGSEIGCQFTALGDRLEVEIAGASRSGATPSHGSFAWTVLSALVDAVDASVADDGRLVITLSMHTSQAAHSDEPA